MEIYQSRNLLVQPVGPDTLTTAQQLFYHLNMTLKVVVVIPLALVFILVHRSQRVCRQSGQHRCELSHWLRRVALALRYIPDVQRDYHNINQAEQAVVWTFPARTS